MRKATSTTKKSYFLNEFFVGLWLIGVTAKKNKSDEQKKLDFL